MALRAALGKPEGDVVVPDPAEPVDLPAEAKGAGDSDRKKAQKLLDQALGTYRELSGIPRGQDLGRWVQLAALSAGAGPRRTP